MKDRIVKFIEKEQLTAAEFADKIGVQRSSVSHVLNGRNNPGFSFIQKILEAFPSLNSRWLLTGDGSIYEAQAVSKAKTDLFSTSLNTPENKETIDAPAPQEPIASATTQTVKAPIPPAFASIGEDKKVSRVLIFYDDQTFEDFRPAK